MTTYQDFDLYNPTEEHQMLRNTVREFVEREVEPQALENNRTETFNLPLFRKLGPLGLLGITVSDKDGGAGMDAVAACIAHEELSASDPAFALSYLAHTMLFVNNFYQNSNADQRARYLQKVINGEWIAGMCMSEPGYGTDVMGMQSRAVRKGDHYLLTGRKMWITNGAVDDKNLGDLFLVYARTQTPKGDRISSFVVEKGFKGFSLGQKIKDKTGMRASATAELVFDDCVVPVQNRLGEEGESMLHMMRNLEIERLTLAAMSLGIARRCIEVMTRYSTERKAFGKPIAEFGQVQRYLGESYAHYRAARAYVYDVARKLSLSDHGNRMDSDGVKLVATTMAKNVADNAMQVLGGYGYVGEYVVERLWRDAKLLEIGGGTLEAHQKNISRDLVKGLDVLRR
ncbi:MAG: acyl-CoA dehydrogenase family protein [Deltaproteobacteria bacterium]|nr:acyl-CoA dehydrogenase family protein [Deltaproteobacteria bacterium]